MAGQRKAVGKAGQDVAVPPGLMMSERCFQTLVGFGFASLALFALLVAVGVAWYRGFNEWPVAIAGVTALGLLIGSVAKLVSAFKN